MERKLPLIFFISLLSFVFLVACEPSQVEIDATSTQIAWHIFSTQTAQAPTATKTPTPTPTSTNTPTQTNIPTAIPTPLPTATPTLTLIPTPSILLALYESEQFPFSIQYPAEWEELPKEEGITAGYAEDGGSLIIAEEDFRAQGLGDVTLEEYADLMLALLEIEIPSNSSLSSQEFVTEQGLSITGLEFILNPGEQPEIKSRLFFYLHEDHIIFNVSIVTHNTKYYENLAGYLLSTFRLTEALTETEEAAIVIGVNAPLTGDIPGVGKGSKFAAELWLEDINAAGGLEVGGQKYPVELVIEDNESNPESAAKASTKLITQDEVLVMIGPQSSKQAVPAGGVANDNETPMISPWSTNPKTTLDRPWVFRTPFLDPLQGPVVANFVTDEFGFTKAAVLYDVNSDYPKGLAVFFKGAWEDINGPGSVVAFERFTTKDTDFSAQLTKIKESEAEFIFTPQYYNEVALIVQQAHELGWNAPIVGSDSWGSFRLMTHCGDDCKGLFFSTHYAAAGATGATKEFIDRYTEKYGYVPDDVGALTWDTMLIVQKAIQDCGLITGDINTDRACIRDALAQIKDFEGITGTMTFTEQGDPIKCAVIAKISEAGEFEFYQQVCPPGMSN